MDLKTVGQNIKKYRIEKGIKQEALAEMADLTPNYIGMLERGDKTPSLNTLVNIANALGITSDMLLCDVLNASYEIKSSLVLDKINNLPPKEQKRIYAVIEICLNLQNNKRFFTKSVQNHRLCLIFIDLLLFS